MDEAVASHTQSGYSALNLEQLPLQDRPYTEQQPIESLPLTPAIESQHKVLGFPIPENFQALPSSYSATCTKWPLPDRRNRSRSRATRTPYDKPRSSTPRTDSPQMRTGFNTSDSENLTPLGSLFPTSALFASSLDLPSGPISTPLVFNNDGSALGFPSLQQYLSLCKSYLDSLSDKKRDKALITKATYLAVSAVLDNHDDSSQQSAAFRFWARKMFSFDGECLIHDGKPVATTEEIYSILVEYHYNTSHGGRDATTKLVHDNYSWIPKEIIARFVKSCPTCGEKRCVVRASRTSPSRPHLRFQRKSRVSKKPPSMPFSSCSLEKLQDDKIAAHHPEQVGESTPSRPDYHRYFYHQSLSPVTLDVTPFSAHQNSEVLAVGRNPYPSSDRDRSLFNSILSLQPPECAVDGFTTFPPQRHAEIDPSLDSTSDPYHSTAIPSVLTTAPSFSDEGSGVPTNQHVSLPHCSVFSSSSFASPCTYNGPNRRPPPLDLQLSNFGLPQQRTELSTSITPDLRTPSTVSSSYASPNPSIGTVSSGISWSNYSPFTSVEHSPSLSDWPFDATHEEAVEEYESDVLHALQDLAVFDASRDVDATEPLFLYTDETHAADFFGMLPLGPPFEQSAENATEPYYDTALLHFPSLPM